MSRALALLLAAGVAAPTGSLAAERHEAWIGEMSFAGAPTGVRVLLPSGPGEGSGEIKPLNPLSPMRGSTLSDVVRDRADVRFRVKTPEGVINLAGKVKDGELTGTATNEKGGSGPFRLLRSLVLDAGRAREYEGFYSAGPGSRAIVFVAEQPDGSVDVFARRQPSERLARLIAVAPDRFDAGASMLAVFPVDFTCWFERDGTGVVAGLQLVSAGGVPQTLRRETLFTRSEVTFRNGDVTLAGDLLVPAGSAPHPGIVLVHGSGAGRRSQLAPMAFVFLEQGFAVLTYDKRGCGASTGDWKKAGFPELALDALAGVSLLRARRDIDPSRVGLYGISQGGWIAPLAASTSRDVAFVIAHSGPGVTPAEQDVFATSNQLRGMGADEKQIGRVVAAYRVLYDHVSGRLPAGALDAASTSLAGDPDLGSLAPPKAAELADLAKVYEKQTIGDPGWYMHLDVNHDPLVVYRKVTCPVLALFGEHDWMVPVTRSAAEVEKTLRDAGHHGYIVKVLPKTGHGFLETTGSGLLDLAKPERVAPGLIETITTFLRPFVAPSPAKS